MGRRTGATTASTSGPLRLRAELRRTLTTLEHRVEGGLGRGTIDAEEVHDIHREFRRLASGLAVWSQLVATRHATALKETTQRLRRLARLVGRARDRDVTTGLLGPMSTTANGGLGDWNQFLGRLRDDTQTGRELLRAFLRTEHEAGLFERIRTLLDLPQRPDAGRGLHRILADEHRLRQRRVRKAHRKARRDPSSERLHRLRIRIRQWRHLASLEVAARSAGDRPPPSWSRLQNRLGRLHDLDVALATVPPELAASPPVRQLAERRRKLRRSIRAALDEIAARPQRATARARLRVRP